MYTICGPCTKTKTNQLATIHWIFGKSFLSQSFSLIIHLLIYFFSGSTFCPWEATTQAFLSGEEKTLNCHLRLVGIIIGLQMIKMI